jgi:hypothetical protein
MLQFISTKKVDEFIRTVDFVGKASSSYELTSPVVLHGCSGRSCESELCTTLTAPFCP